MCVSTLYITFYTTAEAMAAELVAKSHDLPGKLVPVPRVLSAGCGIAWSCDPAFEARWRALLDAESIEWEEIRVLVH